MDNSAKQQIVERLKQATNILVTVRTDPTIDLLSACIGLSLLLDKLDKHAAAVFSGKVPSAMEFLKPEDTIEPTPNSLRDFIIALDKSKADKLRYKVEDKLVRIFITPYKASITKDDLEFSQGDFNIDVLVALGVHAQAELDEAITAHGRILHDATVISINNTPNGNLGSLNWQEISASSVAEMVTLLAADLGENLLDAQIATALLTGVVAETARFSNDKTTPQTMRVAGELMAAGANQQLVASELHNEIPVPTMPVVDANLSVETPAEKKDSGTVRIEHPEGDVAEQKPVTVLDAAESAPASDTPVDTASAILPLTDLVLPDEKPVQVTPPSIRTGRDMLPTPQADSPSIDTIPGLPLNNEVFTGAFNDDAVPQRSTSYLIDSRPAATPLPAAPAPVAPSQPPRLWSPEHTTGQVPSVPASTAPPASVLPPRPSIWPAQPVRPATVVNPEPGVSLSPPQPLPAVTSAREPQTLADLEVSLHSPHSATPVLAPAPAPAAVPVIQTTSPPLAAVEPDQDSIAKARAEVMRALSEGNEPLSRPAAFNAQPLGDRLHAEATSSGSTAIQINADGIVKPAGSAALPLPPASPPPLQFR